jgi:hypothetical protein
MPFAITHFSNEPFIIVTIEVPLDQHMESIWTLAHEVNQLVRAPDSPRYVIFDLRGHVPSFSDIMIGMDMLGRPESWILQPHVRTILVGTHPMIPLSIIRFRNTLHVDILQFDTLEDALTYCRDGRAPSSTEPD